MSKHDNGAPHVAAHAHSSYHRQALASDKECGCFHCLRKFGPDRVREWIDGQQTALCPECGIDSVVSLAAISSLATDGDTDQLLQQMQQYWFAD